MKVSGSKNDTNKPTTFCEALGASSTLYVKNIMAISRIFVVL